MTRKNVQTLVVIAAALAVGVAAWFADDLVGYWRAARPPAGYQGAGGDGGAAGGAASPRVDPPSQAFVPPFDAPKMTNTELLAHYVKQVPLEKSPTLEEWQTLLDTLPKELLGAAGGAGGVTLPLGRGHFVMAMCADLGGNLWIGTEGEGIFRYNPGKPAAEQWAQFTTKDGLGDDYGYAMACDQQGRVWVGHLNHGVSVFNGEKWQTYEVVGGLSRPDTLNGPLGERIFKIAVCPLQATVVGAPAFHDALMDKDSPLAGSVWMASSAGLAVYFPATDTWSYVTRAEGLPSDQANAIAFDRDGTVYVGTQCDGIAMAGPQDHYATWKQVTAANPAPHAVDGKIVDVPVPVAAKGAGLPTDLINDLLVARDGTVYAATTLGLGWSTDHGNSWQYVRGADWIDKVKNRAAGVPQGWQPPTDPDKGGGILAEDYTTSLAEDSDGNLLIGHRSAGSDIVRARASKKVDSSANLFVTSLVPIPGSKNAFRGTYGDGMSLYNVDKQAPEHLITATVAPAPAKLPAGALPPTKEELQQLVAAKGQPETSPSAVAYLGQDWATQGDWVGRYGRKFTILCAAGSPDDHEISYGLPSYRVVPSVIKKVVEDEEVRNWCWAIQSDERRVLWDPTVALRRPAGWDEHGEGFDRSLDGIGMDVAVTVPEGAHRISLYFMNFSGHGQDQRVRDYIVTVVREGDTADQSARARVREFHQGVYQQFVTGEAGKYVFRLDRNYSYNIMLSGVLVDKWSGPEDPTDRMAIPWMGNFPYAAPNALGRDSAVTKIVGLSERLKAFESGRSAPERHTTLVELTRYAQAVRLPAPVQQDLRWNAALWTPEDRTTFDKTMLDGWRAMQELNPDLKSKKWRAYSPFVTN